MAGVGRLLSLGHGYSATALAARLTAAGWAVWGTSRKPDRRARMAEAGVTPLVWPLEDPEAAFEQADHLLISAGPDEQGDPVLRACGEQIAERAAQFRWVGYLSTTGVYGDHAGGWVDETAEMTPATERGRRRVAAEAEWMSLFREQGLPSHIFRLAGIYGPGRGPFAKVRDGTARLIIKQGQVFSRIHVEDIGAVLEASIAAPDPGAIYNLCDDDPAPPQDVLRHAARLLGTPPPPEIAFEEAEMSPMARSFYAESKRVSNARIKADLGVRLKYPSYRDGLAALLAAEQDPDSA